MPIFGRSFPVKTKVGRSAFLSVYNYNLSETALASDSLGRTPHESRSLTDTALASDSLTAGRSETRNVTDQALASDFAAWTSTAKPIRFLGDQALASDYANSPAPTRGFIQVSLTTPFAEANWVDLQTPSGVSYCLEATITAGKQHALDKMEASTFSGTFDNRGGTGLTTFNPWYFMGQNAVYPIQIPLRVLGTWAGQVYPVFWGLIDSCVPSIPDEVNSEVTITASDLMKYMANDYVDSDYYARQIEALPDLVAYWRLGESAGTRRAFDSSPTLSIQVASCTATPGTFTVTTSNNFLTAGIFPGMGIVGTDIQTGTSVTSVSATSLTMTQMTVGTAAITETLTFTKNQHNATIGATGTFGGAGELLYDTNSALDLANSTINPGGYLVSGTGLTAAMNTNPVLGTLNAQNAWTVELWVAANAPITGTAAHGVMSTYADASASTNPTQDFFALYAYPGQPEFGGEYSNFKVITGDGQLTLSSGNNQCNVLDGEWHHVALSGTVVSGIQKVLTLYVDGKVVGTGTISSSTAWWSPFAAGNRFVLGYDPTAPGPSWPGEIDEVAIYSQALAGGIVQFHYDIGRWFYNADYSGDRIAQVLAVIGIPVSFYGGTQPGVHGGTIAKGRVQVATAQDGVSIAGGTPIAITQQTALDYIQTVETTENGAFYQLPSGQIAFRDQYYCYTNPSSITSQVTLADEVDTSYPVHYRPGIQIMLDDQDIFNVIQVQPANGIQQVAINKQSIAKFGYRVQQGLSGTLQNTQQAALNLAYLILLQYQWPLIRCENIQMASYVNHGASMPYQLGLYLYDMFNVIRSAQPGLSPSQGYPQPSGFTQAGQTNPTPDYSTQPGHFVVEHVVHKIKAGSLTPEDSDPWVWETTWVGSPYESQGLPFLLKLDSLTQGQMDVHGLGP